jgi:hypothetical protein
MHRLSVLFPVADFEHHVARKLLVADLAKDAVD